MRWAGLMVGLVNAVPSSVPALRPPRTRFPTRRTSGLGHPGGVDGKGLLRLVTDAKRAFDRGLVTLHSEHPDSR